ncbi:FG-GAP repeat domain-containing protein [Streptomyces termitum]|uniref:FG-GAP repeat domain-containing protein n=1 Tax=Streptomyces termitum TaxID=67368 RepID=UPI0037B3DB34
MTTAATVLLGAMVAPQGASALTPEGTASPTAAPAPPPEEAASLQARKTGKPVEVLARRTETSQFFADPSGTFTNEQYVLPRWTRKDNKLVPIDTDLAPGPDGRLAPGATTTGVSFSGGGTGHAVTIEQDGRSVSLDWPSPLPAPVIEGDTATYREVLPGVDLQLRAGNSGFGQLLVVKTPQAAANPALRTVRMSMAADGLAVSADADGNLTAVNPAGQEVFTAPTPRMWDSSKAAAPAAAGQARALAAAATPPTDAFEPGYGAKEAPLGLSVTRDALSLRPDQSLLTGKDTTYPVFIDPTFSATGSREAWAIAYKKTPTASYYNGAGWHNSDGSVGTNQARVGYENVTNGLARSFFRMDSNNLWNTSKYIKTSTFRIKNVWSWSCTDRSVDLWLTGGISSATNWSNTDNSTMWSRKLSSVNQSLGYSSGCPAGDLAFDTTSAAKESVTKKWNNITIGLRATSETDVLAWKKFDVGTARLTTTYNTYPKAPTNVWTTPDTNAPECLAGPYFTATIGNADLTLAATVTDPDGGTVKARFVLWPTGYGGASNEVNRTVDVASGKSARTVVTKAEMKKLLADNGQNGAGTFSWRVRAEDGELSGPWTSVCSFRFDAARPSFPPAVTSTQFPDGSDGWPETTGMARSEGTFQVINKDTEPAAAFEYWTDWDPTVRKVTLPLGGGMLANLKLIPPSVGRHALSVRSVDAGGNLSDTTRYWFYANGPGTPDKPGDLNGDGLADFYGVRSDGELWFYAGHGTGIMAPAVVASNQDFTGSDITRRGDWTQDGYEDLIALSGATDEKALTVYPNNGFGHACSARDEEADGVSKACQYDAVTLSVYDQNNNHWADADQVIAIGDVDGPLDTNADGVVDVPGHPDLLVKQGNLLWLYYGSADHYLDSDPGRQPKLIGTGGWAPYTLAAPGDQDKDGYMDLIARQNTTGELRLYSGGKDGANLGSGSSFTVIGSAWTATNRPLFTAVPDADKNGTPDLWATTADGKLYFYPNALGAGTVVGTGGWTAFSDLA